MRISGTDLAKAGLAALLAATGCAGAPATSTQVLEAPAPPLADTQAATAQSLCTGDETRSWELLDPSGAVLATTTGVCQPSESADAPGPYLALSQLVAAGRPRYELRMWLDPKGRPVQAQLREPSSTRYYDWTSDALVETHLGDVRSQPADPAQAPTWVVPSHALFMRELMVRLGVGRQAGQLHQRSFAPDRDRFSELDLRPARAEADAVAQLPLGEGHFTLASGSALRGGLQALRDLKLETFFDAKGQAIYRSVSAPSKIEELLPEVPKPSYRLAADLELRPLPIAAKGEAPLLGAELVLAHDGGTSPRPGLLFISGAGAQDRHGIVAGGSLDVGSHEIHDGLARAGFAVLRYDDRGVGESQIGADATPGFLASVQDARRALQALAARPEVDPTQIVVMGHGEGALIAALVAQGKFKVGRKRHTLAAAVLLASPGRNIRELVYDEIRRSLRDRDEFTRTAAVNEAKKIHDAALADAELPASAEPLREWMQEVFVIDPAAEIAKVQVPVLALHGGKDFQVDPTRDFEPVRAALASKRSAATSEAVRLPELDHLFKPEPGESHPGHYRDLARHVDPALVQRIAGWLGGVLTKP